MKHVCFVYLRRGGNEKEQGNRKEKESENEKEEDFFSIFQYFFSTLINIFHVHQFF